MNDATQSGPQHGAYRVLARKYRPTSFDDLIGQDAMVRTISNAFETGRIPQAWILTGVRGVGKTTTARILSRALNYERDGVDKPTFDMAEFGRHCAEIMEGRHPDVLEMDAASNTGVDNIREIIESARYKPLLARFKVHYWQRTDEFTLTLTRRLKQRGGLLAVNPYILEGLDLDRIDKGQEAWTKASGSREADKLFGVIGFAHRRKPKIAAGGIFRQSNPDGLVGYAQGMIYNANPQPRGGAASAGAGWQPVVGWDTLNWAGPVPEYPGTQPSGPDPTIPDVPEPKIRINWQTKLVPTTRLAESIPFQQGELGRVVRRTPWWFTPLSGTH